MNRIIREWVASLNLSVSRQFTVVSRVPETCAGCRRAGHVLFDALRLTEILIGRSAEIEFQSEGLCVKVVVVQLQPAKAALQWKWASVPTWLRPT